MGTILELPLAAAGVNDAISIASGRATLTRTNLPGGTVGVKVEIADDVPVIQTAASSVNGATVTLTYDRALHTAVKPATNSYAIVGITATVSSLAISGTTIVLTLSASIAFGDEVTVAYTAPAASPIMSAFGVAAASFTAMAITNNVPES